MAGGDIAYVHPEVIGLGKREELLVFAAVAPHKDLVIFDPEEFPLFESLFFAFGFGAFGDEKFQFIGLSCLFDCIVDIVVKGFFAFEIFSLDMDILRFVLCPLGECEEVVAHPIHFDIFRKGDRDTVSFKIRCFERLVIGFNLVEVGKDEVGIALIFRLLLCQLVFIGEFCQRLCQFFTLFGYLCQFLFFEFRESFCLDGFISFLEQSIDITDLPLLFFYMLESRQCQQSHSRTHDPKRAFGIDMPECLDDCLIFIQEDGIGIFAGKLELQIDGFVFIAAFGGQCEAQDAVATRHFDFE